jgi:hypothetical protein
MANVVCCPEYDARQMAALLVSGTLAMNRRRTRRAAQAAALDREERAMATNVRDAQLEADLAALGRASNRKSLLLVGAIGLIAAISAAESALQIGSGEVAVGSLRVVACQGFNGIIGLLGAALMILAPRHGWGFAMAWALVQIPVYALTPEGSASAQILSLPLTMSQSTKINGELTSYSAIGINLVGVIFASWLWAWRSRFGR